MDVPVSAAEPRVDRQGRRLLVGHGRVLPVTGTGSACPLNFASVNRGVGRSYLPRACDPLAPLPVALDAAGLAAAFVVAGFDAIAGFFLSAIS